MTRTFEDYIRTIPEQSVPYLINVRKLIKELVPSASEGFSYGVPAFFQNGKTLIYAGFKNHIGLYPTPPVIEILKKEFPDFETSKGAIKIPFGIVPKDLIASVVKYTLKSNSTK